MSPILKVISALQFGPWKSQKLRLGPFPLPPARLPALFFSAGYRRRCAAPLARRGEPAGLSCFALAPTRHATPSPPPVAARWCPLPSPRRPELLHGRHLAVAVARPRLRPPPSPSARMSLTKAPASHSTRSFACSAFPRPRTCRRSTLNAGELKPPSNPHLRTSPPSINPINHSASSPHSSRATLSRPELTGAPSPL